MSVAYELPRHGIECFMFCVLSQVGGLKRGPKKSLISQLMQKLPGAERWVCVGTIQASRQDWWWAKGIVTSWQSKVCLNCHFCPFAVDTEIVLKLLLKLELILNLRSVIKLEFVLKFELTLKLLTLKLELGQKLDLVLNLLLLLKKDKLYEHE